MSYSHFRQLLHNNKHGQKIAKFVEGTKEENSLEITSSFCLPPNDVLTFHQRKGLSFNRSNLENCLKTFNRPTEAMQKNKTGVSYFFFPKSVGVESFPPFTASEICLVFFRAMQNESKPHHYITETES